MKLIQQLKGEHVEIGRAFESIKEGVARGEAGDGELLNELRELKSVLVAHLDLEDKMLYPALVGAGGEAKELGEKFSKEMLGISNVVLAFFGKYISESIENLLKSAEFRIELDGIIKAVVKRVNAEEGTLFPAYEKCCGGEK
jgi:hypothetical protein